MEVFAVLASVQSMGLTGIQGYPVTVEAYCVDGMPMFEIVGLPDTSVRESRERIRSALSSLSIALPARLITVNLAPADVKKIGTMHDLAILLGILVCMERIPAQPASRSAVLASVSVSESTHRMSTTASLAVPAWFRDSTTER